MLVSRRFFFILTLICLILPAFPVNAQGTGNVLITTPDSSKFPSLGMYMDVFDDQGSYIQGLNSSNISILEDGQQITPEKIENLPVPLKIVLAVNSDPALAIRDSYGTSRYAKLLETFDHWLVSRQPDSKDSLTLAWNGGIVASNQSPSEFKIRLDAFDPKARSSTNSLAALSYALDSAQEEDSAPGVKKAILLVSGHLGLKDQSGINDLIDRARQARVRIFVWIVDSNVNLSNPGAIALENMALSTGGRFVTFTGAETLPDPEQWFASLRSVYYLTYGSKIRQSGNHSVQVQVSQTGGILLNSSALSFPLDIQPPSAALLSLPIEVVRQNPNSPFDPASFQPVSQDISVLVEFPDGKPRALKRVALYVDGQKLMENTTEPFNRFKWDLRGYQVSDEHGLQVEVEDIFGLTRISGDVPVKIIVVEPPGGVAGLILRNRTALTISVVIFAGAIVLGIIILGGRRGLATLAEHRKNRVLQNDPVTQPVFGKDHPDLQKNLPLPWLRRKENPPPAYLIQLISSNIASQAEPIKLNEKEKTFGSDPTQATIVLDHPSVSSLHARLRRSEDDIFTIFDQNSIAGTWVNFDQVGLEGRRLKHGDIINFGQLSYRFELSKAPPLSQPVVTPL